MFDLVHRRFDEATLRNLLGKGVWGGPFAENNAESGSVSTFIDVALLDAALGQSAKNVSLAAKLRFLEAVDLIIIHHLCGFIPTMGSRAAEMTSRGRPKGMSSGERLIQALLAIAATLSADSATSVSSFAVTDMKSPSAGPKYLSGAMLYAAATEVVDLTASSSRKGASLPFPNFQKFARQTAQICSLVASDVDSDVDIQHLRSLTRLPAFQGATKLTTRLSVELSLTRCWIDQVAQYQST